MNEGLRAVRRYEEDAQAARREAAGIRPVLGFSVDVGRRKVMVFPFDLFFLFFKHIYIYMYIK